MFLTIVTTHTHVLSHSFESFTCHLHIQTTIDWYVGL